MLEAICHIHCQSKAGFNAGEPKDLSDAIAELWVSSEEVLGSSLLDLTRHTLHVISDVLDHVLALFIVDYLAEEVTRLFEVTVGMVGAVPADKTSYAVRCVSCILGEGEGLE